MVKFLTLSDWFLIWARWRIIRLAQAMLMGFVPRGMG